MTRYARKGANEDRRLIAGLDSVCTRYCDTDEAGVRWLLRQRRVGGLPPRLRDRLAVAAARQQNVPGSERRPEYREVGKAIAVVVAHDRHIPALSPRPRRRRAAEVRGGRQNQIAARRRTEHRDVGSTVA